MIYYQKYLFILLQLRRCLLQQIPWALCVFKFYQPILQSHNLYTHKLENIINVYFIVPIPKPTLLHVIKTCFLQPSEVKAETLSLS